MKDFLLTNTVSQKDEKLHTAGLDDTAIPHIKIQITEIPLEKKAEYRNTVNPHVPLLKFSFRAWQKYCILSLLSLDRFYEGILINISSKKNAFVQVFTPTIRHFETGLFKKSGKVR